MEIEIIQYVDPPMKPKYLDCIRSVISNIPEGWTYRLISHKFDSKRFRKVYDYSGWFRVDYLSRNPKSMWLDLDIMVLGDISKVQWQEGKPYILLGDRMCCASAIFSNNKPEILREIAKSLDPNADRMCPCYFMKSNKNNYFPFPSGLFEHKNLRAL